MKISNGNVTLINTSNNRCFTVNNSTIYRGLAGNETISGTSFSSNPYGLYDLDYSPSEDRIYIYRQNNSGQIGYWDVTGSSYATIYSSNNAFVFSSGWGEQVVKYNDGLVYFNQGKSLFSVQNDGNNSILISSSNDNEDINGVVVVD